jgi:hypothetical protein
MSQIDTILTLIAQKHLGIETLETRRSTAWTSTTRRSGASRCAGSRLQGGVELGASSRKATEVGQSPRTDRKATKPSRKRLASLPNSAFITSPSTTPKEQT